MKVDATQHALAAFEGHEGGVDALKRAPGGPESAFESMLLKKMVSSMRKTVPESGLWSGVTGQQMYDHFIEQALSDHLADHGGIGIANLLQTEGSEGPIIGDASMSDDRLQRQSFDLYSSEAEDSIQEAFREKSEAFQTESADRGDDLSASLPPQRDRWLESPSAHQKLREILENADAADDVKAERF